MKFNSLEAILFQKKILLEQVDEMKINKQCFKSFYFKEIVIRTGRWMKDKVLII